MPRDIAQAAGSEALGFIDAVTNLVWLCPDHHALVERFYWWELSQRQPVLCKGIWLLAKAFDQRQVPAGELDGARAQSAFMREELARRAPWNALWWQAVYARAARWAGHQQVLRSVHPSRAVLEEPWFRDRRGVIAPESENVDHDAS